MLLRADGGHQLQVTLVLAVVREAGSRFHARHVALGIGVHVLPQREGGQRIHVVGDGRTQRAGGVVHHGQGVAVLVAIREDVVDHLVEVLGAVLVRLPGGQQLAGIVVEGRDFTHRRGELRVLLHQRGTEVAVIERLVFLRIVTVVGQPVVDGEALGARHRVQLGGDGEVHLLEGLLAQQTLQADGVGRLLIDAQDDVGGRDVGCQTVQRQHRAVLVGTGMAYPFIAAAGQQVVEALQPADAVAGPLIQEGRVDDLVDRRLPAQTHLARDGLCHVHAPVGDDGDLHGAGVDGHQHDAFLASAVQQLHLDGKG